MKQMNKTNWEVERKQLEEMPFDKRFDGELCHATGYAVKDEYGDWWNEYVSSEGILCYGRQKGDIEELPTVKAIPIEKIKEFRNYITKVNDIALIQKLNELIESEEK